MRSDDEKLVSQTLSGDQDAFGVLVHKYQEIVYAYAFQKVRNEEDAQDVTQEVFWRAYHGLYQLRHPHRFRSWLYTIMSNECKRRLVSVIRTRRRETALEDATDDALRIEPAHTTPTEGWRVDLEQALSELPDDNRVAVSMFYMGDHSLKEISEFLGVSVNTVKGKLYRARQQLGNALSERYGRLLESHKLKGGFLMQFMEHIHHIPSPTMVSSWSTTAIGKIIFSLILAVCVLIGIARYGTDSPTSPLIDRIGIEETTEVILLAPIADVTRSSIPVVPAQAENRPRTASSRASGDQGRQLAVRRAAPGSGGSTQLPVAAAENGSEKLIFSGRVVDNNGVPVADAEILYSVKYNQSESATRTGMDGKFRFEFPRPGLKRWDRVSIVATHPDHAIGWRNLQPQSMADIEIQLATPGIISGKILNEAGEPIQNAEARIQHLFRGDPMSREHEGGLGMEPMPIPTVKTDANGEFVLRGLPQGLTTNLETQGLGYAKEVHFKVPVGTEGLEFRLKREGRIAGRLSYADTGVSVTNAVVALQGIYPTTGWAEKRVDANGSYLLTNLAPGMYNLFLYEGPEGWTAVARELIKVVEGETVSNVDLILVRGGFITGRVTDQDTNEPIADHHISFYDAARPESQAAVHGTETDENGVYHFRAAPGRARVYTSAPEGYLGRWSVDRYVDVVETETITVDFEFAKGIELVGRILNETGEPVAGAKITDVRAWDTEYGRSDESGAFTVDGLRPGQKLGLKAERSELGLRGSTEVDVQPGVSIEIRMEQYERIRVSGRVVDRAGEPIPSVNISLMRWDSQRGKGYRTTVAVTDGNGRFREVELIIGDEYVIYAEADGYRRTETEKFTAMAEMTQIADLVLLLAGPSGQFFIEGRVTDTSGAPVHGARVTTHRGSEDWETHTDENGDYRLEGLSMTVAMRLEIYHPEYAYHEFKILKTNQRHDLVLIKADGYLAGKIMDTNGIPIEQATVMIEAEEEPTSAYVNVASHTNAYGEFELKYIKDSTVSIYVSDDRNYKIFKDIVVNQRDLVLTLTPTEPSPAPTPAQQARWSYAEAAEERAKTLVSQPAPELAVAEWLSGSPISIDDLKGKTVALHFWDSRHLHHVQRIRLLRILQEVYRDKGLVCVTIVPATAAVETVKRHIVEQAWSHPIALDQPTTVVGADGETFDRYAISWSSQIVLIDAAGQIIGHIWDHELESKVQALLAD